MRHGRRSDVNIAQFCDEWKVTRIPLSESLIPASTMRVIRMERDGGVGDTPTINIDDEIGPYPRFKVNTNSCLRSGVQTFEKD